MLQKLFKNPKTRYRNLILVLLPFILLIGLFGFIAYSSASALVDTSSGFSNSIDTMDYHLRNNATDLQKQLFDELGELCLAEADEKEPLKIAEAVAKNFVADFYTWTNKAGSYDVGGMFYVFSQSKGNIYAHARDSFYKYLTNYLKEYDASELLEVSEVTVEHSGVAKTYTYEDESYPAYYVRVSWAYAPRDDFDIRPFKTVQNFTIIENNAGRYEIVQAYGD